MLLGEKAVECVRTRGDCFRGQVQKSLSVPKPLFGQVQVLCDVLEGVVALFDVP